MPNSSRLIFSYLFFFCSLTVTAVAVPDLGNSPNDIDLSREQFVLPKKYLGKAGRNGLMRILQMEDLKKNIDEAIKSIPDYKSEDRYGSYVIKATFPMPNDDNEKIGDEWKTKESGQLIRFGCASGGDADACKGKDNVVLISVNQKDWFLIPIKGVLVNITLHTSNGYGNFLVFESHSLYSGGGPTHLYGLRLNDDRQYSPGYDNSKYVIEKFVRMSDELMRAF